jgi:hypothetical protein
MKTDVHLWQYLAELYLERQFFQTKVTEKIKKKNTFYTQYIFPPEIRAVYKIMRRNMVEPERPQMTI